MRTMLALAVLALALAVHPAHAKELRFAFQGDADSMDPHTLNETFTLGFLGNIYEGLIRRGPDLTIEPALAVRWEIVAPDRWRFHLRRGVKFHEGEDFTADDVLFSADRVRAKGSDLTTRLAGVKEVVKIDDHTVEFVTEAPNPILHVEWGSWGMMSKSWSEKHNAVTPEAMADDQEKYTTRHANGTGPFRLVSREAGIKAVAVPNPHWWDNANKEHNLTKITFTPIASDATRVAALLSGQVDMAYPIPVQDIRRIEKNPGTRMLVGPELRTIFLGMDQFRDELLYSDVKGRNPFKDRRVREAVYRTIDIEAIRRKVMRDLSNPSAMMVGPGINGFSADFKRLSHDPKRARELLAAAGYGKGFEVGMDCPNDRYVNDEAICQAVVSMLAKDRHPGEAQRPSPRPRAILPQDPGAARRYQLPPAGLDAGELRFVEPALQPAWLPQARRRRSDLAGGSPRQNLPRQGQSRRLLQSEGRCAGRPNPLGDRQGGARPADKGGVVDDHRRYRLRPPAPAGAGLGRARGRHRGATPRQPVRLAACKGEVGAGRHSRFR